MFWEYEKLDSRIRELEPFRYRDAFPLSPMEFSTAPDPENGVYPPSAGERSPVSVGDRWTGRDVYLWLSAQAAFPPSWRGRKLLGRFDFGSTGGGGNSGFESLLFVDGHPYQGVDSRHQEVFFSEHAAGDAVKLDFLLWSGLNGYAPPAPLEHELRRAELCWLDEAADDLYFTGRALLDTVRLLGDDDPVRHALLSALDRAMLRVDWSRPGSDDFYLSVQEAQTRLQDELARIPPSKLPVTVQCIGHTHIDVAWLWRLKHTREKAARSFSTVLRLMEQYPEYVFLQTQPQLYDYIKRDYPDIYAQIRSRVAEGRWEADGGMWLEADCNLPSGESLVRQLLYGTRFLRREFGVECRYLWLPDVFGYSWALPQILRKSGISTFMTTKISWNQYNRMPHDTFRWRGIDGTEILTHFITTPDPGAHEGAFYYTYNGGITPASVRGIWQAYRDKAVQSKLLLSYGYGDGGGGPTREMLELRRRLDKLPGLPRVTTGRADDYFRELHRAVDETDRYVHTWDGELYLELHRGTYTSQAYNKRMNRKLELLYREAEWLSVRECLARGDWSGYPKEQLDEGWRIILRNQFHDIIPGSSIREVYEDSRAEYERAWEIGTAILFGANRRERNEHAGEPQSSGTVEAADASLTAQAGPAAEAAADAHAAEFGAAAGSIEDAAAAAVAAATRVTVANGAPWTRKGLVLLPDPGLAAGGATGRWERVAPASAGAAGAPDRADASGGSACPAQRTGSGWLVQLDTEPMSETRLVWRPGPADDAAPSPFAELVRGLDTPYYRIEWDDCGRLVRLRDNTHGREVLAAPGNVLQVFEDKPKSRHEAWDIDLFYQEKRQEIDRCTDIRIEELGPLRAVVRFSWTYMDSTIVQRMCVYRDSRRIDFVTWADWREKRKLLKAAFPVRVRSTEATYDIQFGNVKRPTHWNTSWDYARFECVGHQWADLSERDYGVSLLNDCKYGYDIKDHVMRLTLIKSAVVPDALADLGEHRFTYSLLPHAGDWFHGGTAQEAWALNNPLAPRAYAGRADADERPLFSLSADHVMIDAVKKAEDSDAAILRLHEFAGKRGTVRIGSAYPIASWQETDLLENAVANAQSGPEIELPIAPYEIKTVLIRFRR